MLIAGSALSSTALQSASGLPPTQVLDQPPVVSGVPQEGQALTTTNGGWSGTTPIAYSYQWQRCQVENAIANPSFESDLSGWVDDGYGFNSPGGITMTRVTDQAHAGSASLRIDTPGNRTQEGVRSGPFTVTPGLEYRFVAFVYSAVAGPTVGITAAIGAPTSASYGEVGGATSRSLNAGWNRLSVRVTAPADASWGAVWVETAANKKQAITFDVDDVWVNGCSTIAGATSSSYVVAAADAGYRLSSVVNAQNSVGSGSFGGTQTVEAVDKWDVAPAYAGPVYADNTAAAASDPLAPPPITTTLPIWRNTYDWPNGHGYVGWHYATSAPDNRYGKDTNHGGNPGLWIWPIGGQQYTPNYAEWTYTAPGTTRLSTVNLTFAYRNKFLAHHCIEVGLRTLDGTIVSQDKWCQPALPPDSQREVKVTLEDPANNPTSKVLFFRVEFPACADPSSPSCSKYLPQLDPLTTGAFARLEFADMILVDDDNPIAGASGQLFDLSDTYIDGRQSYGVTVSAHDPGSGVKESWLERVGASRLLDQNAFCDPAHHTDALDNRICPEYFEYSGAVDTNQLPEGTNSFVVRAQDVAGNVGSSITWRIFVDRTPPASVANLQLLAYDSPSATADVGWDPGADPVLSDGTPGSGTQSFEFRTNVNGGSWSDWASTDEPDALVPSVHLGDIVALQVRGVDGVGNESSAADGSVTVYNAGGSLYPYSSPVEDANSVNTLTADQITTATNIAESSPAVRNVVGSRLLSARNFSPWATNDGVIIGASFTLGWAGAATLNGPWLSLNGADDGSYTTSTDSYEADDVTSIEVTVDLNRGAVVSVQPGLDSVVPDSPEPITMTQFDAARRQAASGAAAATADTGVARPVRNRRLINRTLVPGVGNDSWWNWDFNTESVAAYKPTGGANVDMPISLVFWGDVDVQTAKDMWNRGQAETHLFADPMHELVHDRFDVGQPSDHREPASAVWDSDRGAYLGRFAAPRCKMHVKWHYRVYAPSSGSGGDNRLYSPAWSYYVIASSHVDFKEGCSDQWSGDTEVTEHRLADEAPTHTQQHFSLLGGCSTSADPWIVQDAATGEHRTDTLNLYNKDEVGFDASHHHYYFNDGLATMIHVPNISHPLWICTH